MARDDLGLLPVARLRAMALEMGIPAPPGASKFALVMAIRAKRHGPPPLPRHKWVPKRRPDVLPRKERKTLLRRRAARWRAKKRAERARQTERAKERLRAAVRKPDAGGQPT